MCASFTPLMSLVLRKPNETQVRSSFSKGSSGSRSWKPLDTATTRSARATDTAYIGTSLLRRET